MKRIIFALLFASLLLTSCTNDSDDSASRDLSDSFSQSQLSDNSYYSDISTSIGEAYSSQFDSQIGASDDSLPQSENDSNSTISDNDNSSVSEDDISISVSESGNQADDVYDDIEQDSSSYSQSSAVSDIDESSIPESSISESSSVSDDNDGWTEFY